MRCQMESVEVEEDGNLGRVRDLAEERANARQKDITWSREGRSRHKQLAFGHTAHNAGKERR